MKNLVELDCDDFEIYTSIANSKRSPRRERLNALGDRINQCYTQFTENTQTLEALTPQFSSADGDTIEQKRCLLHCYEHPTNELDKLKKIIRESQSAETQGVCQLCGIDSPGTFDHYLPKDIFPEYSVFSKNLIPCCYVCNTTKGTEWIEEGNRLILNLYYDDLPENVFLIAQIIIEDSIPIVRYEIVSDDLSKKNSELITNHFRTLNLLNRYKIQAIRILSSIQYEIKNHGLNEMERSELKNWLREAANAKRECFGINDWQASIYEALAENDVCLDIICADL